MIEVRVASSPADVATCMRLRWTVFVEEQGVRPSDELDGRDRTDAIHAIANAPTTDNGSAYSAEVQIVRSCR